MRTVRSISIEVSQDTGRSAAGFDPRPSLQLVQTFKQSETSDWRGSTMPEPTREQIEAAKAIFCENGFEISAPWDGDLDDLEFHWFETLKKAIAAALACNIS